MNNEIKQNLLILKKYKLYLTRQQLLTLRGQILSNDIDGFRKGLYKILKQKGCFIKRK